MEELENSEKSDNELKIEEDLEHNKELNVKEERKNMELNNIESKNIEDLIVLHEDNQVIVVIKPQNVPSQADISGDEDMLSKVKKYVKEKYNKEGEAYIGLVHRLDRPTGGVMVFARTSKSASRINKKIKNNEMNKTYYAVTTKTPQLRQGVLINYLKKDEKNNIVKIVPQLEQGAKRAELRYKVLQTEDEYSLLEVKLVTGRAHQIRVQFAGINCPLYGDNKYGKDKVKMSQNLGLWAGRLEFIHPTTKQKMTFAAPPENKLPWSKFYLEKYFIK